MHRYLVFAIGFLLIASTPQFVNADFTVYTDRAAWEDAISGSGYNIATEEFNDFDDFTYEVGGGEAFQFPAGQTQIGSLLFDIERPSGI